MNTVAGEVVINTISLYTNRGVLNLVEHVQGLMVEESIFMPGTIAELVVWDTMNLASLLPILGTERLYIEFTAPGRKTAIYDLRVTSIQEAEPGENMRSKVYKIYATTPEVLKNKTIRVSKAYNTTVSNIIEDVIKQYLRTRKKVMVQPTRGIQNVVLPNVRPFKAIKLLRQRSTSSEDMSSSYVFFENQEGIHYKTIENMLKNIQVGDRVFFNNPTSNVDISRPVFRNILAYSQSKQFDMVDRLHKGGLAKEIQKFDYKTLEYTAKLSTFNPEDFASADGNSTDPDYELTRVNYGRTAGSNAWIAHDSGNPDTFISDGSGALSSGTSLYRQGILWLNTFGDSELTAGIGLEANIVETSTATRAPELHAQMSGKYIIGSIRHEIGPSGNNPRYTCSMECIKGAYKDVRR